MARKATWQEVRAMQAEIESLKKGKKDCFDQLADLTVQFKDIEDHCETAFQEFERLRNAIKAFGIQH